MAVTLGERGAGAANEVVIAAVAEASEAERAGFVLVNIDGEPVVGMPP